MLFSVPATSANMGPGFDSLGLSLNLRNHFDISVSVKQEIVTFGEGESVAKHLNKNIFVRIFKRVCRSLGCKDEFRFTFYNNIPVSRGLGSSSALVVGAVFSAHKMSGRVPAKKRVLDMALQYEKHPDNITPATFGGFNACFVKQNEHGMPSVVNIRKNVASDIVAVIVVPDKPISTKYARSLLPVKYSMEDCVENISHCSVLTAAFFSQRWDLLRDASIDRMHEQFRIKCMPAINDIKETALRNGALMSTLSGSGSSVLNVCYANEAKSLNKKLSERFPNFRVLTTDFDNDGVKISEQI